MENANHVNIAENNEEVKMIPLVLNGLSDDNLKELYSKEIRDRLVKVSRITDEFEVVIDELKKNIPSANSLLTKISELKNDLERAQKASTKCFESVGSFCQEIRNLIVRFVKKLGQWTKDYDYLTYGWGQFEEYDSEDSGYDPVAAAAFERRLSNKYIVEVFENDFTFSLEKFIQDLKDLQRALYLFLTVGDGDEIFEQTDFVCSLERHLEILSDDTNAMRTQLDLAKDEEEEGSSKFKALMGGFEQFDDLHSNILTPLTDFLRNLSENLLGYAEAKKTIITTEQNLDAKFDELDSEELDSLVDICESLKNTDISQRNVQSLNIVSAAGLKVIKLRDELKTSSDFCTIKEAQKSISNCEGKVKKTKDRMECLRIFIDIVKADKCILKLQKKHDSKFAYIVSSLPPETVNFSQHSAFVHVTNDQVNSVYGISQYVPKYGIDCPLRMLIKHLKLMGIARKGSCQAVLCLSPTGILSNYERGLLFLVMGIKPNSLNIATNETYQRLISGEISNNVTGIGELHLIPPGLAALDCFNKVSLEEVNNLPALNNFPENAEDLYMKLTMCLVRFFREKNNRDQFAILNGDPVACLIVSKEGKILAWALNTTKDNDLTCHAEINALDSYFMKNPTHNHLPDEVKIFTSLKSCEMCAGGIMGCLNSENVHTAAKVIYGQNDPCQDKTCLSESKIEFASGLKIHNNVIFNNINETYAQDKNKTPTLNASASLCSSHQEQNLEMISHNFVEEINSEGGDPAIVSARDNIRLFLSANNLSFLLNVQQNTFSKCS